MPAEAPLAYRPARTRGEFESALRLVHDNYVHCGYMTPEPDGLRIGPHHALPSARTFVALLGEEVVATLSLFLDSPLCLPADALFADRLGPLRTAGCRLAEVGMFADRRRQIARSFEVLLYLMQQAFWTIRRHCVDHLLITVHPRHAPFYRKLLSFEPLADARPYEAVGNVPAELLDLQPASVSADQARSHRVREVFGAPPVPAGPAYVMDPVDFRRFFAGRVDRLGRLSQAQRLAVRQACPHLDLDALEARAIGMDGL